MTFLLLLLLVKQVTIPDRTIFHKPFFQNWTRRGVSLQNLYAAPIFDSVASYDVLHYNIEIELDFPGTSIIKGWTEITLKTIDTLSCAELNFVGLTIDSVTVNGDTVGYTRSDTGQNQILVVNLGPALPGDTFKIGVSYSGTPSEGIYYSSGIAYVMSIPWVNLTNYPIGARYWFPCKDEFYDKATSELRITVPQQYKVVANGMLADMDTIGTKIGYHWVENYQIPTWYIVFAVSNYAVLTDTFTYSSSMPVIHYVKPADTARAEIAFSNVPSMLTFFSDLFGEYPFLNEKYGLVELPGLGWAMENQTNVFWALPVVGSHQYEIIIAHETSHQWWGCSITPGSVKDIWLNEGFATYCEALYSDYWGGASYKDYMKNSIMNYYLNYENNPLGHPFPTYDPPEEGLWSATTYEKPASMLHMLRHIIGDSTFFELLRTYYDTYKYSNAVSSEFQTIAENISGIELDWFFDEWLYKAGHPEYEYSWRYDSFGIDSFEVYLSITQVQSHDWDVPVFKMPIDIKIYSSLDTSLFVIWDSLDTQDFSFLVSSSPESLAFDPDNWILKKATRVGIEEVGQTSRDAKFCVSTIGQFEISYTLSRGGDISLKIYNLAGAFVGGIEKHHLAKGRYTLKWNTRELYSGVYFYMLSFNDAIQYKGKFIVLH